MNHACRRVAPVAAQTKILELRSFGGLHFEKWMKDGPPPHPHPIPISTVQSSMGLGFSLQRRNPTSPGPDRGWAANRSGCLTHPVCLVPQWYQLLPFRRRLDRGQPKIALSNGKNLLSGQELRFGVVSLSDRRVWLLLPVGLLIRCCCEKRISICPRWWV